MPKGYYTGYSYCGIMPDGRKAYFVTESEYLEAYREEENQASLFFAFKSCQLIGGGINGNKSRKELCCVYL